MQDSWTAVNGLTLPALFAAAVFGAILIASGIAADILILAGLIRRRWNWRTSVERLCAREWRAMDGAVLLLALAFVQLLLSSFSPGAACPPGDGEDSGSLPLIIQTLLFHGVCGAAILLLVKIRGLSWQGAFGVTGNRSQQAIRNALRGVIYYAAAMPPVILLTFLYRLLLGAFDIPLDPQAVVTLFVSPECPLWLRIYLSVLAVAVAPVIEEMCFRGIALPLFARKAGTGAGVAAVSLIFAAIHFHLPSLVPLFGIAAAFSLAYIHTGSIVTPIVMHALFNATSIGSLFLIQMISQNP